MADEFVSGRELSSAFYAEVVYPLLGHRQHSAALLGWGSDVLGFDTEMSTHHGWGPRMQLCCRRVPRRRALPALIAH